MDINRNLKICHSPKLDQKIFSNKKTSREYYVVWPVGEMKFIADLCTLARGPIVRNLHCVFWLTF